MSMIDNIAKKPSSDDKDATIAPQTQPWPGLTGKLHPIPDHGEKTTAAGVNSRAKSRLGQPAECVGTYVYLVSDDAGLTTAAKINVAGGIPALTA